MPKIIRRHRKYFMLSFLVLFFIGGQPSEFGQENVFFQGFLIQKPVIRVALGVNLDNVLIRSSSGMKIYQVSGSYKLLAENASEVRTKGHKEKLAEKFIVQVAQVKGRDKAEEAAKEFRSKVENRVYVIEDKENPIDDVFQVRVGDFLTRNDALDFIKKLGQIGIKDAWIFREEVTATESKPQWVMVNDELINLNEETALYFIPVSPESFLSYGGHSYRGIMILKGSRKGILLINILNLEDYLKGVVPGELSPYNFGELEALKAQAVAARTYALKNIGQFEELGFDLFATPVSQVYDGISIEHPLSTQAVDETSGQVAVYNGKLINALYMSTCGGATENIENMFDGSSVPYLRGTECTLEKERTWSLQSSGDLPSIHLGGIDISPKLAYLMALNILPLKSDSTFLKAPAEFDEVMNWIRSALELLGKKNEKFMPKSVPLNFVNYAHLLTDAYQWQERVQNLLLKNEADHILKDSSVLNPEEKNDLAYLVKSGIFPSTPDFGSWERALSNAEAAYYLYRIISTYKDFYHQGNFKSSDKNIIEVMEDGEKKQVELSPDLFLLEDFEETTIFASSIDFSGGEAMRWVESDGKVRLIELFPSPITNILDQPSQYHRWQARISREDLEARVNLYFPIGKLIDLVPQKRGVSKRVIEMSIIGQEDQVRLTGLKIRQALGLRDNLFVIDRQQNEDGKITHFIFTGKGWGHGVGLCQVGAYRMAQKGATCEDILKKYYQGISINKIF